jgi:CO/xanthine dehydrogenase Mo-binding subunit
VGGSYGNKQSLTLEVIAGALLSMACNKPVKFFETKVEQMINHEPASAARFTPRSVWIKTRIIRAVQGDWTVDTGAFCNSTQGQVSVGLGEMQIVMAKCLNWDLNTNIVVTNKQPAGIVRGYGGQELNSCLSLLISRVMEAGNFDPVEIFQKNYISDGDCFIWRDGLPWRAHTVDYVNFIGAAAEKFNWKEKWKGGASLPGSRRTVVTLAA